MATGTSSPRRKPRENQYLFDLGVRGRKTGLTVPDSGIRDEHGLEPMDDLFSSPAKLPRSGDARRSGLRRSVNATISTEEDMDFGQSTIPEPAAVLTDRKRSSIRMPIPRSKSPIKTFLQSSPRRHPSLGPRSSPIRGSIVSPKRVNVPTTVNRRLDFSVNDLDHNLQKEPVKSSPRKRTGPQKSITSSVNAKLTNGTRFSPKGKSTLLSQHLNDESHYDPVEDQNDYDLNSGEDSYQVINIDNGGDEDRDLDAQDVLRESSHEPELESPIQITKKRRRSSIVAEPAIKQNKSKPQSQRVPIAADDQDQRPAKKARGPLKKAGSSKVTASKKPTLKTASKGNSSPSIITSSPQVQRGPPRPKNNRGLYILRRETPDDGFNTRSGRHVIKPVAYWKNETVVYGDDDEASGEASFLLPTIKEVIRADRVDQPESKRSRKAPVTRKHKRSRQETDSEEEEDLTEPWESEPGSIYGPIRLWNPEDPLGQESTEKEDEIALSSAAIITRDIPNASFKFAKTLTLPFFGSGLVDLPPGAVKKPKNSRRMQMVFFVFSGRVSVTVNENSFRIGKGGMWQVPRGNFYSIENDYDKPARIFFSQGCDIGEAAETY